jgi:hypothetical protein
MANGSNNVYPAPMTMYERWRYGKWIPEIPQITTSGTYTLHPVSIDTNNCFMIESPYSNDEFFVIEYRNEKKGCDYSEYKGMLVYRINNTTSGNGSLPYQLYIYRPNDISLSGGIGLTPDSNIAFAMFNDLYNRTAINNTTDPISFLSDGSYGGLNITQIKEIGDSILTFYVAVAPPIPAPSKPLLISPSNASKDVLHNNAHFVWHSVENATHYKVNISDLPDFTGFVFGSNKIQDTTFDFTLSVALGTTYYWRVCAYNAKGVASEYSDTWKYTTDTFELPIPNPPMRISPKDNASNIKIDTLYFRWHQSENAVSYTIIVSSTENFEKDSTIGYMTDDTTFKATVLNGPHFSFQAGHSYWWKVGAMNEDGEHGELSSVWKFTLSTVGIENTQLLNSFYISPNPTDNEAILNFSLLQSANIEIKICDITGSELQSYSGYYENGENTYTLDLHHLQSGTYICNMFINGKVIGTTQFIKL